VSDQFVSLTLTRDEAFQLIATIARLMTEDESPQSKYHDSLRSISARLERCLMNLSEAELDQIADRLTDDLLGDLAPDFPEIIGD